MVTVMVIFRVVNILLWAGLLLLCESRDEEIANYQEEVWNWLGEINRNLETFNSMSAAFTWNVAVGEGVQEMSKAIELFKVKNEWKNQVCSLVLNLKYLSPMENRMLYLLCRGPRYSAADSIEYLELMENMSNIYNEEFCWNATTIQRQFRLKTDSLLSESKCFHAEPDLDRLMKRTDLTPDQSKRIWHFWHDYVGPKLKVVYPKFVELQNRAARANGYEDVGATWREELETDDLEQVVFELYEQIKPLYDLLHAVIRHKLLLKYGDEVIDPYGPIPIYLLGNMWGQDWSPLISLLVEEVVDLNSRMSAKNWTVQDMVLQAEDMYASWGLPRMSQKFWSNSVFEGRKNLSTCHGTAANMYHEDDYRMLLCAQVNMEDFYVIHHEMGHVQYYMAYKDMPAIFQDGANTAFHESIGDVAMHAALTPQHLNRLGLLTDSDLVDERVDMLLLFKQVLAKIPEIPFALIVDKYRWDIFRKRIKPEDYNRAYWDLNEKLRGVVPPSHRSEQYFDASAKFHIPDNTPYIRYFLSNIVQMDLFKSFCQQTLFGKSEENESIASNIPLFKCDLYGSKRVGKKLKKFMEMGASKRWPELLQKLTGKSFIDPQPLLEYYEPVYNWLKEYVLRHNVHVGW